MTSKKSATPGRRKLPEAPPGFFLLVSLLLLGLLLGQEVSGAELRRSMGFIRPWLMGDAYVAVADEASSLFYNPAGLAGLPDSSAELLNPQLNVDELFKTAILDPDAVDEAFADKNVDDFRSLLGQTFFANFNLRVPSIVRPKSNVAYGIGAEVTAFIEVLENPVLPGLRLEFFFDKVVFYSFSFQPTKNFKIGFTPKLIERIGVDRTYTLGELFAAGESLSIEGDPALKDAQEGTAFRASGLDMGFLYYFSFWPGWSPRVGLALLNIGGEDSEKVFSGMKFGPQPLIYEAPQAGELKQLNTIGFAVSPTAAGIRYTIAFDIVDFTQTVLPGDDLTARTRLGFEMGIGPRGDGTAIFSILAGLNAGHPTLGILSRVWIFEVGFGNYAVETGQDAGDKPDRRFLFLFGIRI